MYRIGTFSRITKVTVKALRFYEEEGLLEPSQVDPANGYRYYDSGQLPRVHRIVALKQCGFSLEEIRRILAGRQLAATFARRRQELEKQAGEIGAQLAALASYIDSLKENPAVKHQTVVKSLPGVTVFSKRMTVASYDSYFREIPAIGEEMRAANPDIRCLEDPPYCFIICHDGEYKESGIDMEFCEAVTRAGRDTATITFKTVPPVAQAACVLHQGPYAGLREAYAAVFKWIDDNGFEAADNPRESYIDGIWNRGSPADWLTEVQVPIRPRS